MLYVKRILGLILLSFLMTACLGGDDGGFSSGGSSDGGGDGGDNSGTPAENMARKATVSLSESSVNENVGSVNLTVSIPKSFDEDLEIHYSLGGSTDANDYGYIEGMIIIPAGDTSASVQIFIAQDVLSEPDEVFTVTLNESEDSASMTILDDDSFPVVTIDNGSGLEGGNVVFPITLSLPSYKTVSFDYTIVHGTTSAGDFLTTTGTLSIPPLTSFYELEIPTVYDGVVDTKETFSISTSNLVNGTSVTASATAELTELIVAPRFPENGADWNDYVLKGGYLSYQPGFECTLFTSSIDCVNGGGEKAIRVEAFSSCSGLALTDTLGIFKWTCEVSDGAPTFFSEGFNAGKGLRDLVTESGYNNIHVELTNGGPIVMESEDLAGWWSNPIVPLPDNAGGAVEELNVAGAIYVEDSSKQTRGYNINADRVSMVTGPGVTLTLQSGVVDNCDSTSAEMTPVSSYWLLCIGNQKAPWVEIDYNMASNGSSYNGINYINTDFARFHGMRVVLGSTNEGGLDGDGGNDWTTLTDSEFIGGERPIYALGDYFVMDNVTVRNENSGYWGGITWGAEHGKVTNVKLVNNSGPGIWLRSNSEDSVFHNIVSVNNGESGIQLDFSSGVFDEIYFSNILVANNGEHGISATDYTRMPTHFVNVTAVNNVLGGLSLANDDWVGNTDPSNMVNSFAINNGTGIFIDSLGGSAEHYLSNVFLSHNTNAITIDDVFGLYFQDTLGLFSSGGCTITNATIDIGIDSSCNLQFPSNGAKNSLADLSNSIVGKAGTDAVNGTAGVSTDTATAYGSISDWYDFENPYRVWGRDGSAFPNNNNRGRCNSGTCNIWDFSLSPSDTVLRNANGVFVPGAPCPASVHGDQYMSTAYSAKQLKYALEILNDGIGDEDGLCETGESCMYSPHIGAYQGDVTGDYKSRECIFQDGAVSNVKMYSYPD